MTTTYDPRDKQYVSEHDLRLEMARVFDICHGCRQCVSLCPTFPALVTAVSSKKDADAGRLTPEEQDAIAEQCFRCTMCSSVCPYTPDRDERAIDFPRLIDRHRAMQKKNNQWSLRSSLCHLILGRSLAMPRWGRRRLSKWFDKRDTTHQLNDEFRVVVFPTCVVEVKQPHIGQALVEVYEHNGVSCSLVGSGTCCGAPALHHGEMSSFLTRATKNVRALVQAVKAGEEIVVPNPTCFSVIKTDYPHYLGTHDAELVAAHTYDSSDYLVRHHENQARIEINFAGEGAESITHHVPLQLHARGVGESGRILMSLTGAHVTDVVGDCGMEALWGRHGDNEVAAHRMAVELRQRISVQESAVTAGSSPWAHELLRGGEGAVLHPMEVLARAYGFPDSSSQ